MLKINKTDEPDFFEKYKRSEKPSHYQELSPEIRSDLKEHMLIEEQNEFCPYCEAKIEALSDGHIEHFKPRDRFSKEQLDYDNLIVSCNRKESCGHNKGNHYSEFLINPVVENPNNYFLHSLADGEILPKKSDINHIEFKKANATIDILGLNTRKLRQARNTVIKMYSTCDKSVLEDLLESQELPFPTLLESIIEAM